MTYQCKECGKTLSPDVTGVPEVENSATEVIHDEYGNHYIHVKILTDTGPEGWVSPAFID